MNAEGNIESDLFRDDIEGIDASKIINYHQKYLTFRSTITKTSEKYIIFWTEMMRDNPSKICSYIYIFICICMYIDYQEVITYGGGLNRINENIQQQFKDLIEIDSKCLAAFIFYALYLKQVVFDQVRAHEAYFG